MMERRITVRMIGYWDTLRKDKPLPSIHHFNPEVLQDLWPQCMRFQLNRGGHGYIIEHAGEKLAHMYGRDVTGAMVSANMHEFPGMRILKDMEVIRKDPQTLTDAGHFMTERSTIIRYRACMLPFCDGRAKEGVTNIITGFSWKEME